MTFTRKKGFGKTGKEVKPQNKNENRKSNQKGMSQLKNFPKEIRMFILNQNI